MLVVLSKKAKLFLLLTILCLITQRIISDNTEGIFWQYVEIAIILLGLFFAIVTWHIQKPVKSKKDIMLLLIILSIALLFLLFPYFE